MALTILPANTRQLKKCFDCEDYCMDVEWYTILETEDDGYELPLCNECIDRRNDGKSI
jgi:hypothetical protein